MSDTAPARTKKTWMPNRMFDPVSNPFAVQNMLVKDVEKFRYGADDRSPFPFVPDRLVHEEVTVARFTPDPMGAAPDEAFDAVSTQSEHTFGDTQIAEAAQADVDNVAAEYAFDVQDVDAAFESESESEAMPEPEPEPEPESVSGPVDALPAGPDLSSQSIMDLLAAAREEGREEGLEQGRQEGHQQGFTAGYAQASTDLQHTHDTQLAAEQTALRVLCEGVQELANDGDALFEPLKRLSLHLAEQLVRGELSLSGHAISRLVDNCVREMTGAGEKTLQVQLHPEDLEQYRPLVAQYGQAMSLRANPALKRGSVRVSLESTVVEDLIEHRLEALAKTLSQPASGGGSGRSPLAARLGVGEGRQGVEEVRSRTVAPTQSTKSTKSDEPAFKPAAEPVTATVSDDGYV